MPEGQRAAYSGERAGGQVNIPQCKVRIAHPPPRMAIQWMGVYVEITEARLVGRKCVVAGGVNNG